MSIILGVDIGGSTTKIIGMQEQTLLGALQVRASDQTTSMYGAIGHFLMKHQIALGSVSSIVLTGVGASFVDEAIYGIDTHKVDEFQAIGRGGLYVSGIEEAFVVSLGTGTAFVRADQQGVLHIGGSGVGGGTLLGLASQMVNKRDMEAVLALAENGCLENVDLSVKEILHHELPSLPLHATASNFGKIKSTATDADLALGIINMVLQTVGMMAVFAARNDTVKDVVLTGTLTTLPQVHEAFATISDRYGVKFIVPQHSVYATAIGAALHI